MLTGRCKKDFEEYLLITLDKTVVSPEYWHHHINEVTLYDVFDKLPKSMQSAYIIEWFDSVGIYIIVDIWHREFRNNIMYFGFSVENKKTDIFTGRFHIKTRQEATKAAIEKANELYNDNFK